MRMFDYIAVIYNPKSTGHAIKMAKDLCDSINGHFEVIQKKAVLHPTQSKGDAVTIARTLVGKYEKPLLISVSGDGGYNEVINGAIEAKSASHTPVVAVMPAGNANDHYRVMAGDTPLIRLIKTADISPLDLIYISVKAKDFSFERYGHSYIGFGITSEVGRSLNRHGKSPWNELRLTLATLKDFTPFTLVRGGTSYEYDSLVFANIKEMAKGVKLSAKGSVTDGKFERVAVRHRGKLHTVKAVTHAVIFGFKHPKQFSTYRFMIEHETSVQVDGETWQLPAKSRVVILSKRHAIDTIL